MQPNEDVVLSLFNERGNPSVAQLSIQYLTSAVAGTVVEQAQTSAQKLSQPLVATVSDAVTNTANVVSNQQKLITSFDVLMKKLGVLIKVGDAVTKIHPYVKFAWQVPSAGLQTN